MKGLATLVGITGLIAVLLSGCSSTPKEEDTISATETDSAAESGRLSASELGEARDLERDSGTTSALDALGGFQGGALDDPNSLLAKRVVYFEFDSAVVRDEFTAVIEAHAAYLADNPTANITLEGHADERGTREYNLGLGERRAQAVKQFLSLMGASSGQVRTISYGEERPDVDGHDEESWRLNRRVEIVYER